MEYWGAPPCFLFWRGKLSRHVAVRQFLAGNAATRPPATGA